MRVTTAVIVVLTMVLLSCTQSVSEDRNTDYGAERISAPGGDRSICLAGDSRVFMAPEDFLADEWNFVYNQGIPGITSETTRDVIASQQFHFNTMIVSVGINDCNMDRSIDDIVSDITDCLIQAKTSAEHVYVTTIPGVRESIYFTNDRAAEVSMQAEILNIYIPIIAQNLGVEVIYLDGLLCDGVYLKQEYDDGSGIHYTEAAYAEVEQLYSNVLSKNS